MDRLVKILNIAAFCFSIAAAILVILLAFGMAEGLGGASMVNRTISNSVAGYACCYGLTLWIKRSNITLAVGLMVIGTLIIAANIIVAG